MFAVFACPLADLGIMGQIEPCTFLENGRDMHFHLQPGQYYSVGASLLVGHECDGGNISNFSTDPFHLAYMPKTALERS